MVDFLLCVAINLERNRLVEFEYGTAVQRRERLPLELERDGHHRTGRSSVDLLPDLAVSRNLDDFRLLEDRDIKICCLFSLIVEPQAGADLLTDWHGVSPIKV